ncbi:MAG: DUF4230 domain-containing protein [Agathobacter sp.]|nr:DUF4230 domain-containing protein [Agathobacter sp.]
MKRFFLLFIIITMVLSCVSCGKEDATMMELQVSDMREICELATMDCYYHNVAKFNHKNAETFLWFSKDKHFWVEYEGIVTLGIDASKVTIVVDDNKVTITIPKAEVLGCKVDETSLSKDSFIVDKDSAKITAEDEKAAFKEAEKIMLEKTSQDETLLAQAQQRAKVLIEEYVKNMGECVGIEYKIVWKYLE